MTNPPSCASAVIPTTSSALATVSLLAVSGDEAGTLTPGRERSRRVCSAVARALAPFIPGAVGRYDEDWSPRAFGDNLTAWGTPVVLIESGGLPPGQPFEELTRLNFVALLTTLSELARDDAGSHDPAVYEGLARNAREEWTDVVFRGGRLLQPGVGEPYRADVAFDVLRGDRTQAGCDVPGRGGSSVAELGDARFMHAGRSVDASGTLLAPAFVVAVRGGEAEARDCASPFVTAAYVYVRLIPQDSRALSRLRRESFLLCRLPRRLPTNSTSPVAPASISAVT